MGASCNSTLHGLRWKTFGGGISRAFVLSSLATIVTLEPVSDRISAGLLMFRRRLGKLEVFLAHPGGPYFQHKDAGYWTIPKGTVEKGERLIDTARREFEEEVGITVRPSETFLELGSIRQKGGKIVHAWAFEGDHPDGAPIKSVTFKIEWPPESGVMRRYPEIDRAGFFSVTEACERIKSSQIPLIERLVALLHGH